jgi:predicted transcriptional regulator
MHMTTPHPNTASATLTVRLKPETKDRLAQLSVATDRSLADMRAGRAVSSGRVTPSTS